MIPARNKELFLRNVADGMTLEEACVASQISKPSVFRFFKADPAFRSKYDDILFWRRKTAQDKSDDEGMARLKAMITKRK